MQQKNATVSLFLQRDESAKHKFKLPRYHSSSSPAGCPQMPTHPYPVTGATRLPLAPKKVHNSRSAVSSASSSQCLAPNGISLKAKTPAYYSASLRLSIVSHFITTSSLCQVLLPSFLYLKHKKSVNGHTFYIPKKETTML